jgi:hypothetical protein
LAQDGVPDAVAIGAGLEGSSDASRSFESLVDDDPAVHDEEYSPGGRAF